MLENNPLVSIIVITYNSSSYVIDTLESINCQSYKNIELIISDDCSRDNTVEKCREWFEKNNSFFVRKVVVTSDENTGISPNCNRGLNEAKGDWVRIIAGDDCLYGKNTIDSYMKFINSNQYKIVFGKAVEIDNLGVNIREQKVNHRFFQKTVKKQYRLMLKGNKIPSPTGLFSKELFEKETFDENFAFIEDYPFYLRVLNQGYQFGFLNDYVFKYRKHDDCISGKVNNGDRIYNPLFVLDYWRFFINVRAKELLKRFMLCSYFENLRFAGVMMLIVKRGNNPQAINIWIKLLSNATKHAFIYKYRLLKKHFILKRSAQ